MAQEPYHLEAVAYQDIDCLVGKSLKFFRKASRLSQEDLAHCVGLSAQQIQKYEKGHNRIGASRLFALSQCLKIQPQDFFSEAITHSKKSLTLRENDQASYNASPSLSELLSNKETKELLECYYKIEDPKLRKHILGLMDAMAQSAEDESLKKAV